MVWRDGRLRTVIDAVQPPPRLVDWSIFVIVIFEALSGLVSFTIGSPTGWPLFWMHRIAGLTLIGLLIFKLARVQQRLTNPSQWQLSTSLSALTVLAVAGVITTGMLWVFGLDIRVAQWTLLSVHIGFGLLLVPLMIWHLSTRFRLPRRRDLQRRRTTLKYSALLLGGTIAYHTQEHATRVLGWPGGNRRFTGSQPRDGSGNRSFPATSWVADDPDPIDPASWALTVRGAVDEPLTLAYDDLTQDTELEALLDCTSGWYTVQAWQGIQVGDILQAMDLEADAQYVRFVSVTGYRWSLPMDEARHAVLATHIDGEPLSHGHGAPMRLVAPGRRGFQWVKWIDRIDIRRRRDPAQWIVTLISGFTEA